MRHHPLVSTINARHQLTISSLNCHHNHQYTQNSEPNKSLWLGQVPSPVALSTVPLNHWVITINDQLKIDQPYTLATIDQLDFDHNISFPLSSIFLSAGPPSIVLSLKQASDSFGEGPCHLLRYQFG